MCEATAFVMREGREDRLIENVNLLENQIDRVKLTNLFGEEIVFGGRVKSLSLLDHKIILEAE